MQNNTNLWQRILSDAPKVAVFDSGLDDNTIDSLFRLNGYQASQGYDFATGTSFDTDYRTSSTMFDMYDRFRPVREELLRRIEEVTGEHHELAATELLQLTRYEPGQQYKPHWDNFNLPNVAPIENDRVATCILYLNDDFEGGQTTLNNLGIAATPKRGYCLYFSYPTPEAVNLCLHAGTPVTNGIKKISNLWIRQRPIQFP